MIQRLRAALAGMVVAGAFDFGHFFSIPLVGSCRPRSSSSSSAFGPQWSSDLVGFPSSGFKEYVNCFKATDSARSRS
jgi:hypothetical protein